MENTLYSAGHLKFLKELQNHDVRHMVVGAAAAALQGAGLVTADIDLWIEDLANPRFHMAAEACGGFYLPPDGAMPPRLMGKSLSPFDLVTHMSGLGAFDKEYQGVIWIPVEGIKTPVLPLKRIIVSKRAANRSKDVAVLPILEQLAQTLDALDEDPSPGTEISPS